ncbi:MAG TPA: hypothetical protein VFQ61_22795 [Polyangiaceae bacterium]|nr:hypothetical protein [Polyangiaceae bacterium]
MRRGYSIAITLLTLLACSSEKEPTTSTGQGGGGAGATQSGGSAGMGGNHSAGSSTASGASAGGSSSGGAHSGGGSQPAGAGASNSAGSTSGPSGSGSPPATGICGAAPGQWFGSDYPFNQRIDQAALDTESRAIVEYLQANHRDSRRFRIDGPSDEANNVYGLVLLGTDAGTIRQSFEATDDFYDPDCDPAPIPLPARGAIEGETSYACEEDGDCHLIVVDAEQCKLHEMWRANRSSPSSFSGGCQAIWDLRAAYTPTLRGDCCTSADAAGLPILAQTFTADEIAAGRIAHAIRFILPNEHIRERIYVRPATHATDTTGPANAPPYGVRMRLKAGFDDSGLKPAARVVVRALKEYGMILSDGGNLTFTAANDRFTTHKWSEVDLMPGDLTSLNWSDFEVPELGERYTWDDNCECRRTPIR